MPRWAPDVAVLGAGAAMVLALLAAGTACAGWGLARLDRGGRVTAILRAAAAANLVALLVFSLLVVGHLPDPTRHAADAVRAAIVAYAGLHIAVATLFSAYVVDEARRGELGPGRTGALRTWSVWQGFTVVVSGLGMAGIWAQAVQA